MAKGQNEFPVIKRSLVDFHRRLQRWYAQNGRKTLPWRNTTDAYAIYISEIMLQQTQVKTVLERYYTPFLQQFPTLESLAAAPQKNVLKAWQGLGYYNRAINLHKTAKRCKSALPHTVTELMELPGIGKNTAQAVAAFAYHQPVAVMEANVKRIISRLFAIENPTPEQLWQCAGQLLDRSRPFDYNQAMMDLGAMVCTKRAPQCGICPANTLCQGKTSPERYPAAKKKKAIPVRKKHIVVLRNREGKYFAEPCKGKFLNGLYQFVEVNISSPRRGEVRRGALLEGGHSTRPHPSPPPLGEGVLLGHIRQQYSHFTLEAQVQLVDSYKTGKYWYTLAQLKRLPMSAAEQKILGLLTT